MILRAGRKAVLRQVHLSIQATCAGLLCEVKSAREAGESEATPREGAAESAVDQRRSGASESESREASESARPAGEAEAARRDREECGRGGEPTFESG